MRRPPHGHEQRARGGRGRAGLGAGGEGGGGTTTTTPPTGACSAAHRTTNTRQGGFQGEVTGTAGSSGTTGWTLGAGQAITQLWDDLRGTSGSSVTVRNADCKRGLQRDPRTGRVHHVRARRDGDRERPQRYLRGPVRATGRRKPGR
ncbi:cellulose binding domain-containing protein [Actinosynnema pretiosum]|uniref:cellulose binding domain-containing protein n=1 Tax=Actinosynnema pretiosum TaxID=42197 RepID=UPI0012FDA174